MRAASVYFAKELRRGQWNNVLERILATMSDLLRHTRRATGTIPAAVELALHQHDEIAIAIEDGSSARARRAMTAHMQSAIWAIDQVGGLDQTSTAHDAGLNAPA